MMLLLTGIKGCSFIHIDYILMPVMVQFEIMGENPKQE